MNNIIVYYHIDTFHQISHVWTKSQTLDTLQNLAPDRIGTIDQLLPNMAEALVRNDVPTQKTLHRKF